jgi:hypothetical protein
MTSILHDYFVRSASSSALNINKSMPRNMNVQGNLLIMKFMRSNPTIMLYRCSFNISSVSAHQTKHQDVTASSFEPDQFSSHILFVSDMHQYVCMRTHTHTLSLSLKISNVIFHGVSNKIYFNFLILPISAVLKSPYCRVFKCSGIYQFM